MNKSRSLGGFSSPRYSDEDLRACFPPVAALVAALVLDSRGLCPQVSLPRLPYINATTEMDQCNDQRRRSTRTSEQKVTEKKKRKRKKRKDGSPDNSEILL